MDLMDIIPLFEENDEDVALCDYILNTKNRTYHYIAKQHGVFDLEKLSESYCWLHFRFYKADIKELIRLFNVPDLIRLKSGVKVFAEEALCIVLQRLAYPNR